MTSLNEIGLVQAKVAAELAAMELAAMRRRPWRRTRRRIDSVDHLVRSAINCLANYLDDDDDLKATVVR